MISFECKDCGKVDAGYVECVRISWNRKYQEWDIDPNGKGDKRCSHCDSGNIDEEDDDD